MDVPFFPNTGDGTHCWQAVLKMVLAVFEPEHEYSYDELDRISAKFPGKWTWPTAAMSWLIDRGYELRLIEEFDYHAFSDRGADYILQKCGEEVAKAQLKNSDLKQEVALAKRFSSHAPLEIRLPTIDEISEFIDSGWVVICNVNAAALHGREGYSGHFVVVVRVTKRDVILHDPGLPPHEGFKISRKEFMEAWAYPTEHEKNLLVIKKP